MLLGLDFGNVLKRAGESQLHPGAAEGVAELREIFGDKIYVVSRVDTDEDAEGVKRFILDHFDELGIPEDHIFFCRGRHEKAPIVERLGVTHFIDDRTEVLSYMKTVPHRFALNPTADQLQNFPPDGINITDSWSATVSCIVAHHRFTSQG